MSTQNFQCTLTINNSTALTALTDSITGETLSAVSGRRYYITDIFATNEHATLATKISILSITDTTQVKIFNQYAAPVGGGFAHPFITPKRSDKNAAIKVALGTAIAADVNIEINGYYATEPQT